ncbi:MAG: hypothetical protein WCF57_23355 [Pyrinomonadaceae bacterium]
MGTKIKSQSIDGLKLQPEEDVEGADALEAGRGDLALVRLDGMRCIYHISDDQVKKEKYEGG